MTKDGGIDLFGYYEHHNIQYAQIPERHGLTLIRSSITPRNLILGGGEAGLRARMEPFTEIELMVVMILSSFWTKIFIQSSVLHIVF